MNNAWKIYMLAFIGFFVSTSEYVMAGILDQIAAWAYISVSATGQLITVFAIANAIGSPIFNLAALAPETPGIMLSLYGSILQIAIAAVGGIGGIAVEVVSIRAIGWIAALFVAIAVILMAVSLKTNRRFRFGSN
ncbi:MULTISPECIES: hypothetical protein [Paenibacillus]|uniref:Major facilitator superfamily (MFS) profile domain-containing protein n=1 Tax=Paenibacillus albilobatus TaxID=2716884 RepID=A0A919XE53_9BACL|nr:MULTISPECIES: hypothetical protein [Paenibacillus]GIO28955.1 hypothetical protein J2TS6_00960 [Paenibacillus albilobatus]